MIPDLQVGERSEPTSEGRGDRPVARFRGIKLLGYNSNHEGRKDLEDHLPRGLSYRR